jgi:hypothetical protein
MGRILFIDLADGKVHEEDLMDDPARGPRGYGIGGRIFYERMKP